MRWAAALCALAFLVACNSDDGRGKIAQDVAPECGLPTPLPDQRAEIVPEAFVEDVGAELVQVDAQPKGGMIAVVNLARTVTAAQGVYRSAIRKEGFEVVQEENEGFEAELYFFRGKRLGLIQIRQSLCRDASVAFINITTSSPVLPSPTVTGVSPSPS